MDTVRSKDGTVIAYDRVGNGPPLVLVAGALTDRRVAMPLATLLSARFAVYSYDRRGRGDSGDTRPYAVEREIEDLAAVIADAGGSALVYGHSSGGALALRAAAAGLAIARLAVYEPPFVVDGTREPLPATHLTDVEALLAAGRRGEAVETFMLTGPRTSPAVVAQMRQSPWWPAMEAMAGTLVYESAVMGDMMGGSPAPLGRFRSLRIPVLAMDGGASPDWARNAVAALVETIPGAERITLAGQTHAADPAVLAPVLEAFFSAPIGTER